VTLSCNVAYLAIDTVNAASTIAIRYATVRRQGTKGEDGLERQVITYPSVYYRLMPVLSRAYVYLVLGRNLVSSSQKLLPQWNMGY
jgi:acyl-CoA oxidase